MTKQLTQKERLKLNFDGSCVRLYEMLRMAYWTAQNDRGLMIEAYDPVRDPMRLAYNLYERTIIFWELMTYD